MLGYVGSINEFELEAKSTVGVPRIRSTPKDPEFSSKTASPIEATTRSARKGSKRFFEDDLRGIPGTRTIEVDNVGNLVRELPDGFQAPRQGADVVLTIDIDLQAHLEDELNERWNSPGSTGRRR